MQTPENSDERRQINEKAFGLPDPILGKHKTRIITDVTAKLMSKCCVRFLSFCKQLLVFSNGDETLILDMMEQCSIFPSLRDENIMFTFENCKFEHKLDKISKDENPHWWCAKDHVNNLVKNEDISSTFFKDFFKCTSMREVADKDERMVAILQSQYRKDRNDKDFFVIPVIVTIQKGYHQRQLYEELKYYLRSDEDDNDSGDDDVTITGVTQEPIRQIKVEPVEHNSKECIGVDKSDNDSTNVFEQGLADLILKTL